jgi:predicted N-acyltransferase
MAQARPQTRFLPGIGTIDRAGWDRLYGARAEGFDYYAACETAPPPDLEFLAAGVQEGDRLIAGAPMFTAVFRLAMSLQGRFPRLVDFLERSITRYVCIPVLCAGTPYTDELALAIDSTLDADSRDAAFDALIAGMMARARTRDTNADVIGLKDVTEAQAAWADPILRRHGYTRIPTLPVCILDLPYETEDAYVASLSQNQRSNLRRKLKKAKGIRVEVRASVAGLESQIAQMREATRQAAAADYGAFEQVAPGYFEAVLRRMPETARALLYWKGEELIGFALVFLEPERMIFQYIGLKYPAATDHGLYFLNWMTMVRMCLERGIRQIRAGQTTYVTKCRLGCRLERSWIYFRHRTARWNLVFRLFAPLFAIDRIDPDLRALGKEAPYRSGPVALPTPGAAATPAGEAPRQAA